MEALQAASRRLAGTAEHLSAAPASAIPKWRPAPAAANHDPQPQEPCHALATAKIPPFLFGLAAHLVIFVSCVIDSVGSCVDVAESAEELGRRAQQASEGEPPVRMPPARALQSELAAALARSSVLEHAARTVLLLVPLLPSGPSFDPICLQDALLRSGSALVTAARLAGDYDGDSGCGGISGSGGGALIRSALRGRCVRHATLSVGIALLAAADGGPAYGMPPSLLAALPTRLLGGAAGPRLGRQVVSCLRAMVLQLEAEAIGAPSAAQAGPAQRTAPGLPGRRGSLALVLRVGWLAAASAHAHDGAAATTAEEAADRRDGGSTNSAAGGGRAGDDGGGGSAPGTSSLGFGHRLYSGRDVRLYNVGPRRMYMEQDAIAITAMEALEVAWGLLRVPRLFYEAPALGISSTAVTDLEATAGEAGVGATDGAAGVGATEGASAARADMGGSAGASTTALASAAVAAPAAAEGSALAEATATAVAEAAEWWRLVVAMARHASLCVRDGKLRRLVQFLKVSAAAGSEITGEPGALRPAPEPRPLTAAALAGGLLPCLERLLRRAGRDPAGPEAEVVRRIVRPDVWGNWFYLAPLLAYGDPRQAASLLATATKLLRVLGPWAGVLRSVQGQLMECAITFVASVLTPAVAEAHAAERGAGTSEVTATAATAAEAEPPHAAARQLTAMVSYAVSEWLPALAEIALDKAQDAAAAAAAGPSAGAAGRNRGPCTPNLRPLMAALTPLLPWFPILAARCGAPTRRRQGGGSGSAGAPGCQAGAATGTADGTSTLTGASGAGDGAERAARGGNDGAGDGGISWASLLLHDLDAVRLLGAVLEFVPYYPEPESSVSPELLPAYLRRIVAGCRAVAAVAPRVGPSGDETGAEETAAAAAPPLWRPELVRLVGSQLRVMCEFEWAAAAEVLATELEEGRGGGRSGGGISSRAEGAGRTARRGRQGLEGVGRGSGAAAAALGSPHSPPFLLPPSEARRLLRTCANPRCANLGGDSDAELTLRGCAGCGGAAAYCSRDCQTQHWRAGHREVCGSERGAAAAGRAPKHG